MIGRSRLVASTVLALIVLLTAVTSCADDQSVGSDPIDPSTIDFNQGLEKVINGQPIGWIRYGYGDNRPSWSLTTSAHSGRVAQTLKISKYRSGDRKLMSSMASTGLPVDIDARYTLSAWYKLSGKGQIVVFRRTGDGTWSFWASGPELAASSTWKQATTLTPAVPAGTTGISFGVALESNGTLTTDDYAYSNGSTPPSTVPPSSTTTSTSTPPLEPLLLDTFTRSDGLVTNEFAYWNPTSPLRIADSKWILQSGSLFARSGVGWTGVPDDVDPNATSSNGTNSATFRAVTTRDDFTNVVVSFKVRHERFVTTGSTPAVDWDGEHVLLRHPSQYALYYASFNRRDGTTAIKKKVADGPSNSGVYYTLDTRYAPMSAGVWHDVRASIVDRTDGTVFIQLWVDGILVGSAVDNGIGGPIIRTGQVGIRGDNTEFEFDDFRVDSY